MARQFTTPTRDTRIITFTLDGEEYDFTPPKNSSLALGVIEYLPATRNLEEMDVLTSLHFMQVLLDWLGSGLPDAQGEHLLARLRDSEDPLDIDTLAEVCYGLMEEMTARPTKRSSGSSPSPSPTSSTDGPSPTASSPESSDSDIW